MKTLLSLPKQFPCLCLLILGLFLAGCSRRPATSPIEPADPIGRLLESPQSTASPTRANPSLDRMGYSIQVGAFASLENAVRFERILDQRGIDAFYFRHESGLFKVRFGNHADYQSARQQAEQLSFKGLIDNFFIVIPESYSISRSPESNQNELRDELVKTAQSFIGIPYRWGGPTRPKASIAAA